jgi:hypothetical protein
MHYTKPSIIRVNEENIALKDKKLSKPIKENVNNIGSADDNK